MNEIALLGAIIGLSTGILTLLGSLWKVFNLLASLQRRDDALQHDIESLELVCNGLTGRIDHIKRRLTVQISAQNATLHDIEGWMIKNTEYERRSRPDPDPHTTSQD